MPFRLDTTRGPLLDGECVNDPEHQWADAPLVEWRSQRQLAAGQAETRTAPYVPMTMGHYTRKDIPIHYLLADTFTMCDNYHCSRLTGTLLNTLSST